ncbi:TetR/AcrR family transcriptional regulator [Maritimibacter sp. DP1N21-5]|uniref:TetR/AcrR family transcriptional regulator n=1 Tax=Maritimibacter sp. DP1N21-5 TaxID=2836867 RepID=UPI001C46947D|nr:TetR/AcrR family transcriptional regulator [Maritimibacter sp. DP1N21-5]MBV7409410.1 TetR/AcrR family transcriptional regulator [Maritimibacter sp. DP1N21-5]
MQADYAQISGSDDKAAAILAAATQAFARYGYRRTSMADVAAEAGMSRAALYLHFKNKEDIFTSLVQAYFGHSAKAIAVALSQGGTPEEALARAFEAKMGPLFHKLMESPHGAELLDAKAAVSPEIVRSCEAQVSGVFERWLRDEAAAGRLSLAAGGGDAALVAELIIGALNGVVMAEAPLSTLPDRLAALAAVLGRGLRV